MVDVGLIHIALTMHYDYISSIIQLLSGVNTRTVLIIIMLILILNGRMCVLVM